MSENVLGNQSRERTQSLFDMLINNSRNDTENSSYVQNQHQQHLNQLREQNENAVITSSFIENLLTEYLISLPTSLEEFYKIMGEIYVGEILKQCPHIGSPVELMKETLLGRINNTDGNGNKSFLNNMIRHILQSNLQSHNSNPFESQVMRNMMYREPAVQSSMTQLGRTNSAPEYTMMMNPTMSSLIQTKEEQETPKKLNAPKIKPSNDFPPPVAKKRDLKASKIAKHDLEPQTGSIMSPELTKKNSNTNSD